jgi:DNA/RNA-binding domain of Phe-tRNA-synthetase-like protein
VSVFSLILYKTDFRSVIILYPHEKITYAISPEVFDSVPEYVRAIVLVKRVTNSLSPKEVQEKLIRAQENLASRCSPDELAADRRITLWCEAFVKNAMNPKNFRPAHEALSRRIVSGKFLPSINTLVDIGNTYSISFLSPIGVHPLDTVISSLTLHKAVGDELFTPFHGTGTESPKPGEIVLSEGKDVFTRAWIWRQSASSITLPESKHVVVNIDMLEGNKENNKEKATEIAMLMISDIKNFCGGDIELHILDRDNQSVEFVIE